MSGKKAIIFLILSQLLFAAAPILVFALEFPGIFLPILIFPSIILFILSCYYVTKAKHINDQGSVFWYGFFAQLPGWIGLLALIVVCSFIFVKCSLML